MIVPGMAAGFGDRCPELSVIDSQLKNMTTNLNSLYSGATFSKVQERLNQKTAHNDTDLHSWESLANSVGQQNHKYIQIAQSMASSQEEEDKVMTIWIVSLQTPDRVA